MTPPFITIREAADQLSVSYGTVRNLITRGRLKAVRFGTGRGTYRIAQADLDAFLLGCEVPGPAPAAPTHKPRGPAGFTNLDPGRLLAAWRQQGVLADRRGGSSARS